MEIPAGEMGRTPTQTSTEAVAIKWLITPTTPPRRHPSNSIDITTNSTITTSRRAQQHR